MLMFDMGCSSSSTVRVKVDMTSLYLAPFDRGVKIWAKASSFIVLGKLCVTDIGRCKEKKADKASAVDSQMSVGNLRNVRGCRVYIHSLGTCCVLGTEGRAPWASVVSLALRRLRFSLPVLVAWAGEAVTWPVGRPFGESLGLEGFEEE